MYLKMRATTSRDVWYGSRLKLGALVLAVALVGCAARGPQTVPGDAFDYSAAISKTRSDQMLLNIVRSRYTQVPNFLTVSSVIAGYTYQGTLGASAQSGVGRFDENFIAGSVNLNYIERPTITYTPLQGEEFSRRLMRNIPVEALFSLGQAGWPTDVLFRIAVERFGKTQNMGFSVPEVVSHADERRSHRPGSRSHASVAEIGPRRSGERCEDDDCRYCPSHPAGTFLLDDRHGAIVPDSPLSGRLLVGHSEPQYIDAV